MKIATFAPMIREHDAPGYELKWIAKSTGLEMPILARNSGKSRIMKLEQVTELDYLLLFNVWLIHVVPNVERNP